MMIRTLLSAALLSFAAAVVANPQIGQPAPAFSGIDSSGKTQTLADYRGRNVMLEWTNHDCPYVRKHYGAGNMQALQREAADKGVVWLSIISSAPGKQGHVSAAEADALTRDRDATPHAVILDPDGEIGRLYAARTTPHMYLIDGEGTLVYMGGIDSVPSSNPDDIARAEPYAQQAMHQLLAGEPIGKAVTRPYGCSVKY